jgi:PAS domain S-box-containing protein
MTGLGSLWFGLAYLCVYAAGTWLLHDYPLARSIFGNAGLILPPVLVCVIILRRRPRWFGCHRLFWDTFGIGVALWAIGHIGWTYDEIVVGRASWLRWHTVFSLCGGIGPLVALFARPHRGVRSESVGTAGLVIAGYGLLAVFIYSYFVLVPSLVLDAADVEVTLLALVQVHRAILFVSMAGLFYFARATPWRSTFWYLAMATGLGLGLRLATNLAILSGSYHTGTLYDLAWIAPFLLYAQAVLVAPDSASRVARLESPTPVLHAAVSAVPVLLIPLIGYGGLIISPMSGADPFRALLTGLMTVAGLALLTLRLAAQGTELQRADARLRLLAAATEQTADLILITRANGAFEHANDAFVRALGYSRQELAGLSFLDLMERGFENLGRHINAEVRERGIWRGTILRRRSDGSNFPAACTVVGLKDEGGAITHFVGVERDTTDELKLRDQLVHSERLSAIGELVAGVAHEINNPLQTIVGSVELMMEERNTVPSRRDLEIVRREATRAGQIVRNLLSFVRRSAPDRVGADLNDIVRATVELRDFHLRQRNVKLELDLEPAGVPVLVNREEIQQIVLNLLLNAEHAILAAAHQGGITMRTWSAGRQQVLEIADDGPGVSSDLRGRIFEPFFTTKEVGQGTGLGLSISHGIASAHGGALALCETAKGACFRLTLPAHAGAVVGRPLKGAGADALPTPLAAGTPDWAPDEEGDGSPAEGGTAPVALVVDDELPIRELLARLLSRRGYEVHVAETGEAALSMNHHDRLGLVLCDVRMPGLSGFEFYSLLVADSPSLAGRFVFITGDRGAVSADRPDLIDVPVLAKPFTAADLDAVLATMDTSERN